MDDRDDDELEAKMEEFLRLQAERESGARLYPCTLFARSREVAWNKEHSGADAMVAATWLRPCTHMRGNLNQS